MDCIGSPPFGNNQVEERFEPPSLGPFRGCRSKASPTGPSVSERIGEECVLLLPDWGGSLKRLHRPNLFGLGYIGFNEKHARLKIPLRFNLDCPQCGPYEASEGIYLGRATKTGGGQGFQRRSEGLKIGLTKDLE